MFRFWMVLLFVASFVFTGCGDPPTTEKIAFDKTSNTQVGADGTVDYTISGLDDKQAYRITLVVDANVTTSGDGTATFKDGDSNGAADAGASENIALITKVNGTDVDGGGAKTVPGGSDDPKSPSGIFPKDGKITLTIKAVGAGKVFPVAYHNGGESTFLEIDDTGKPKETYAVGGSVEVTGGSAETITFDKTSNNQIAVDGTVDFTISGLNDKQAYRITLVVDANVTTSGDGTGTFKDGDSNGAADAGASENIALITKVNGTDVDSGGAKTVPGGSDDPKAPSGIFPKDGKITLTVTGKGAGKIYPVAYHNGGESTFLEIDDTGKPKETYAVGGSVEVTGGGTETITFDKTSNNQIAVDGTVDYTISGLDDKQAYRITLVVDANVTTSGDGTGTFKDGDSNGAADAGASENIALITKVNGTDVANGGAKTVPGGTDDPKAPSGIFPKDGKITLTVMGKGAGKIYPVAYHNGGDSTFLEIDDTGKPKETYAIGGSVEVTGGSTEKITFDKTSNNQIAAGETVDFTISGLDDKQAYRITLVVDANVTTSGDGTGTFKDGDSNGAADAGASENIALITKVNGTDVANGGAKTVPGGTDDPKAPSGIFPSGGKITLTVTGKGAGKIYPVAYHNGGESTFLEIDSSGKPKEAYAIGGSVEVTGGGKITVEPAMGGSILAKGTIDYTITGLDDKQAYRITLVVDANVTTSGDGTGTFKDDDSNGAADAGASENIALITKVNGTDVASGGAKTVPGGTDDPKAPSGIFPSGGKITLTITGKDAGKVYPVIYHNGGNSTFLEIDSSGKPTETYIVAGPVSVVTVSPDTDSTIATAATVDYTITGLDDKQAYRITLVVGANVTTSGDGTGTFKDDDSNGAADAGASENIALITKVNGTDVASGGAKTVPGGTDDPKAPSGIFPSGGKITLTITGKAAGKVYPVIYHNGGNSTFLEIDSSGKPIETYYVATAVNVQ